MKKTLYFLPLLLIGIWGNSSFSQESAGGNQPAAQGSTSLQRKAYPGGRDESDLTVQPHKHITKREAQGDEPFEEETEIDTGNSEDFGE